VEQGGPAHVYPFGEGLRVAKFSVGAFDNNVYVVSAGDEALLIDGAAEPERILREVEGLEVVAILQTHNHADHVQALARLVEVLGAPVLAHPDDPLPLRSRPLRDGEAVPFGGRQLQVLHTPGHTPGSLCFEGGGFLFAGDTLFPGGPGNTAGNAVAFGRIMTSLDRLFALADETHVCPGHGIDTTIGRERPYVATWRERGW
jgi:glyoxylase-like metal-dependent hydrolase (beta-lactamase superfamily II)